MLDAGAGVLVSHARDADGLLETFSLLHTLLRLGDREVVAAPSPSVDDAVERIVREVEDTYPSFELRSLDWHVICERHREAVRAAADPIAACQRWLAELQDAHTRVWPASPPGNLPYALHVAEGEAVFARVPRGTAGARAGAHAGWRLTEIDGGPPPDAADWWARTGAPGHARPYIAGRRLLAGPADQKRRLTAAAPDGRTVSWLERPTPVPFGDLVTWRRLASRAT